MSRINQVEVVEFSFEARNLGPAYADAQAVYNIGYKPDSSLQLTKYAVVIRTDDGARGEYVAHWGGTRTSMAQTVLLAPNLLGRDPDRREYLWSEMRRELRQHDGMGIGPIDIALWDLAGKRFGASVSQLLGAFRDRLKAYASTYHGDRNGGLDSPQAFADFAERCHGMGYRAFKVHGWHEGDAREEAANVLHVAKAVGDRMTLMLDPANELRTFADALYVGRACDEGGYFWYEDPMRDSGQSAALHRKLREMLETPLLITEYVRGVEPKADFIVAGGTDYVRVDPEYDMGITGGLKIAHLAEAFGLDAEVHACGPAHRHLMSALRNSNFYELALVGPDCPNMIAPVYACGYTDQLDCVGEDGCVGVPSGPGLGVAYDWGYIRKNAVATKVFR